MASAKHIVVKTKKVVTEKKPGIELSLTQAEAEALKVVLYHVSGHDTQSPRKYTDRILQAMDNASVAYEPDHYQVGGNLYFMNYNEQVAVAQEPVVEVKKDTLVKKGDVVRIIKSDCDFFF